MNNKTARLIRENLHEEDKITYESYDLDSNGNVGSRLTKESRRIYRQEKSKYKAMNHFQKRTYKKAQ